MVRWSRCRKWPFALVVGCAIAICAEPWPQPPCGGEAFPPYPTLETSPTVRVWKSSGADHAWKPPACTGWTPSDSSTIVVTAARFRFAESADGLRRRIGAVSETIGTLYWSTTQKRWQKLILDAHALAAPDGDQRRPDFSPKEVAEGQTLFFQQEDNLFGAVTYRMRIRSASAGRLVFDVENALPIRYLKIPVFQPGEVQSIYYLEPDFSPKKDAADVWRYYAMARTSGKASALIGGHEASAINRAVALYRRLAGIPTDQEPPAAR